MDTRRLRYFLAILEAGSISRAAADLGLAQPALSQQLAVLETELKVRLFDRSPAGVTPTPAGRAVASRARGILQQLSDLRAEARAGPDQLAGGVALGMSPTLAFDLGLELAIRLLARHPLIRLRVLEVLGSGLRDTLERGDLDLALTSSRAAGIVRAEPLFTEELFLITAPALQPAVADIEAMAALPWIVTTSPNAMRGWLDARFSEVGLEPRIVAESNSLHFVVQAAEAGLGATVLGLGGVRDAIAAGRLVATPFTPQPFRRTIHLAQPPGVTLTPSAAAVREVLVALISERQTA